MSDRGRYAEGQREEAECRKCGQPIWIVYHGPQANHTVEPRPALELEQAREAQLAPEEYAGLADMIGDPDGYRPSDVAYMRQLQAKLRALASGAVDGGERL